MKQDSGMLLSVHWCFTIKMWLSWLRRRYYAKVLLSPRAEFLKELFPFTGIMEDFGHSW